MSNVKHLKDKNKEEGIKSFIANEILEVVKEQCR